MAIEAPAITIRNLLKNNWESSNTSNSTPKIHTGWWSESSKKHQLTITNPEESEATGSETGYSGIGPDGPNKFFSGIIYSNVWATREQTEKFTSIENPKQLTWLISEEIDRILTEYYDNPGGDLDIVGLVDRNRRVDPEKDPTVYRFECVIGYVYNK